MFLIRTAFWLSLVVLLLPADAGQQARLYHSVSSAVHHAATFCDRNEELCERGAEHWASFRKKLEFGVRVAVDVASERLTGSPRTTSEPAPRMTTGTLTPADMAPVWRGRQKVGA